MSWSLGEIYAVTFRPRAPAGATRFSSNAEDMPSKAQVNSWPPATNLTVSPCFTLTHLVLALMTMVRFAAASCAAGAGTSDQAAFKRYDHGPVAYASRLSAPPRKTRAP